MNMLNAISIDLEDWPQAVLNPALDITPCIADNTLRVLDLLDSYHVQATFFALGKACEAHPGLLPDVAAAGHEIASHGYGHHLVWSMSPSDFAADTMQSVQIIEAQTGCPPLGYRAPAFSVTTHTPWVGPILRSLGFRYSSSVFPIKARRYGTPDAPRGPHRWANCDLIELPLATVRRFGRNFPACGGGYTRLLPALILARNIRNMNAEGLPAVLYLHPYELAVGEVASLGRRGLKVPLSRRLTQSLWRSRVRDRLVCLLDQFAFGPVKTVWQSAVPALCEHLTPQSTVDPQCAIDRP